MKDKFLFIALTDMENLSDGVAKKVNMQSLALDKLGYDVTLLAYKGNCPSTFRVEDGKLVADRPFEGLKKNRQLALFAAIPKLVKDRTFKKCLIRYPNSTPMLIKALKAIKGAGIDITIEIPSYPLDQHKPVSMRDVVVNGAYGTMEKLYSPKLKRYVSRFYSIGKPAEEIYGIPVKNIPNGMVVEEYPIRQPIVKENELHILFSAKYVMYHGADRILKGLVDYYKSKSADEMDVILEVAGDGPELEGYKRLAEEGGISQYVNFYGFICGDQYTALFDVCGLACSCLAPHRVGFTHMSPLKSREYLARGIPYIYSYVEIGMDEDFPYARYLPSEESDIDIRSLVDIYKGYKDRQPEVANEMRKYAQEHYTWESIFEKL